MIKQFVMEYCEALHPDDVDAQDELFRKVVNNEVEVSMEEMSRVVDDFRMKVAAPFDSFAAAETAHDKTIARSESEKRKRQRRQQREDLYNRLFNHKFESSLQYLTGSGLEEHDQELIHYLAKQFGNCGWIEGAFCTLINASLRSLPGYVDYLKSIKQW